jgi:hypothetical protein
VATNSSKINEAVQNCLNRCYAAENPLVAIADCLAELRAAPGWTDAEILQVEATSRRMLRAVLDPSDNTDPEADNLTSDLPS